MAAPDPEVRRRSLARMQALAVDTQVPMTFGLVATRSSGYLLDFLDDARRAGGPVHRPDPLPGHLGPALVQDQAALRPPADVAASCGADPWRSRCGSCGDADARRRFVDAAVHAEYGRWAGVGAQARPPDFDGIRVYERGLPPNPSVSEVAAAARASTPPRP